MINQKDVKSNVLKNINMYFESIVFWNNSKNIQDNANEVDVGFKEIHQYEGKQITIRLFCKVEQKNCFILDLCLVGVFLVGNNYPTDKLLPNAIAIMFPYLRTQVTMMTSQPSTIPVVIPAININSFLEKQNKKILK